MQYLSCHPSLCITCAQLTSHMSFHPTYYQENDTLFMSTDTCNCRPESPAMKVKGEIAEDTRLTIQAEIERLGDKVLKCLAGLQLGADSNALHA